MILKGVLGKDKQHFLNQIQLALDSPEMANLRSLYERKVHFNFNQIQQQIVSLSTFPELKLMISIKTTKYISLLTVIISALIFHSCRKDPNTNALNLLYASVGDDLHWEYRARFDNFGDPEDTVNIFYQFYLDRDTVLSTRQLSEEYEPSVGIKHAGPEITRRYFVFRREAQRLDPNGDITYFYDNAAIILRVDAITGQVFLMENKYSIANAQAYGNLYDVPYMNYGQVKGEKGMSNGQTYEVIDNELIPFGNGHLNKVTRYFDEYDYSLTYTQWLDMPFFPIYNSSFPESAYAGNAYNAVIGNNPTTIYYYKKFFWGNDSIVQYYP